MRSESVIGKDPRIGARLRACPFSSGEAVAISPLCDSHHRGTGRLSNILKSDSETLARLGRAKEQYPLVALDAC